MKNSKYSAIIVGSGASGLFAALELSKFNNLHDGILLISKSQLGECNSRHAQGGIVGVLKENEENSASHIHDTLVAGAGLSDFEATKSISEGSEDAIRKLIRYGVEFDKDKNNNLCFTLEAAHSIPRILHSGGDATGYCIEKGLLNAINSAPNITVYEDTLAVELLKDKHEKIKGVIIYNSKQDTYETVISPCVILATGGMGQLYKYTTNPSVTTADGQALAYRAGAVLQDMEFIQFHPTSLAIDSYENRFLISEALRGEGAKLVDVDGKEFMSKYDERKELATRDVVTRAIYNEMEELHHKNMYLDITHHSKEFLQKRFPTIFGLCLENNIDISKDLIPVSPAAHYSMGGIKADTCGRTSVEGLFAIGEVASTGLHGANRLASNSLMECVVTANNLVNHLKEYDFSCSDAIDEKNLNLVRKYNNEPCNYYENIGELRARLQDIMWDYAGIIRSDYSLRKAKMGLDELKEEFKEEYRCNNKDEYEFRNLLTIADIIVDRALERKESRGSHYREDFPQALEYAQHSYTRIGVKENVKIFAS